MSRAQLMWMGALALIGACGPKGGSESESASESNTGDTGATGTTAEPEPTTGAPTTETPEPTSEPTTEASTTDAPEPTTGEPADCPKGQEPLAPLWSTHLEEPPMSFGSFYSGKVPMGRMADGRIVLAVDFEPTQGQSGLTLLLVTPDGELLAPVTAALGTSAVEVHGLHVGADDQPRVLITHFDAPTETTSHRLAHFGADMSLLSQVELNFPRPHLFVTPVMAQSGDTLAVAGAGEQADSRQVARLAPDTGVPLWQAELEGPADLWPRQIAVGPQGDIAVAAHADFGVDAEDTLRLWRFDPGGALIWDRVITVPVYEDITALHFAPDDQIVVLRGTQEFTTRAELISVEVATGDTRWELTVAAPEGDMTAWAQDMLVDADRFTIPVSRSRPHHDIMVEEHSLELRTVSLAGELLDVTPLPGVLLPFGTSWVRSLRGRCGELILLESFDDLRMFAFAQ